MAHAEQSVSVVILHQGCGLSLGEILLAFQPDGAACPDLVFAFDFTGSAQFPFGVRSIGEMEGEAETLRRLQFFVEQDSLPIFAAPLLVKALWDNGSAEGLVLAYQGVTVERLLLAKRMLAAGSEAVLLRDDNRQARVLGLALNLRNRRLIQHWRDCVAQFMAGGHQDEDDLDASLGSSIAAYLCDNVTTLRGLENATVPQKVAQRFSFDPHNQTLLRLAVRKLLPSIKALQINPTGSFVEALNLPAEEVEQDPGLLITNLMRAIWAERRDLQDAFNLTSVEGKRRFVDWFLTRAKIEFDLGDEFIFPIQQARAADVVPARRVNPLLISRPNAIDFSKGLNLIGYPRAEMGMGEQLRSCADSLAAVNIPFGINDFNVGIVASHADRRYDYLLQTGNPYPVNLFHLNADQVPLARDKLGASFFRDRYNIGYWEWELSNFPESWLSSIDIVDEIWAPSKFIHQAISARTKKPVVWMPLAVEFQVPQGQHSRSEIRAQFKLPEKSYLFLFSFDFSSFSARKNYRACLTAFRNAFSGMEDVGLVLKTIRHRHHTTEFWELLREAGDDRRVHVIDTVLRKSAMRGLIDACDCFVSLHRSEGFGLSIAEAMYLSKPVIVTNYSGNVDFTRRDTCYLVDFQLIPVKQGEYIHPEGQVWADPDLEQASLYMRRLYNNPGEGMRLGRLASEFMKKQHNFKRIGKRYSDRLTQLLEARNAIAPPALPDDVGTERSSSMHRAGQLVRRFF